MVENQEKHTISVLVENKFGVLARVAGLFSGRGYNISSLTVHETEDPAYSKMTIVTTGDAAILEQIDKQLRKLVDVIRVDDLTGSRFIEREIEKTPLPESVGPGPEYNPGADEGGRRGKGGRGHSRGGRPSSRGNGRRGDRRNDRPEASRPTGNAEAAQPVSQGGAVASESAPTGETPKKKHRRPFHRRRKPKGEGGTEQK